MRLLSLLLGSLLLVGNAMANPHEVELERTDAGWRLLVGGEPYYIKGAGGFQYLDQLAKAGGNTIRTWGVDDNTPNVLDDAHANGLKVVLGIWFEHERKGFDYNDAEAVARQLEGVRDAVLKYKDHPALLAWSLGNEMEGYENADDAAIWSHVQSAAAVVKRLDPDHPTMTVVADVGGFRIPGIHRLCPDIDIVGINSYGGAASLPERYRAAVPDGYEPKPFAVMEFGPPGTWEVGTNDFGVPEELTSTQKAEIYTNVYETLEKDSDLCLGSFAFLWGAKREATSTWFGMFLADGSKVAAVDAMAKAWGGKIDNHSPSIEPLAVSSKVGKPGDVVKISTVVADPDNDDLKTTWVLSGEQAVYFDGGDVAPELPTYPDAISDATTDSVTITLPDQPAIYRLYATVHDGNGAAATASIPFLVEAAAGQPARAANDAPRATLPVVLIGDDAGTIFAPSGWMGNVDAITYEPADTTDPKTGKTASRIDYNANDQWGGIVWQSPADDWGQAQGGLDLTGATKLTFWAKGAKGGEKITFGFGGIGKDQPFFDTSKDEVVVTLNSGWQRYAIDLRGKDLSRIKSGFRWSAAADQNAGKPFTFYLDDVRYE
jgi:hypothetical protein